MGRNFRGQSPISPQGIDPAAYAKDLRAFGDPGKVSQLIVSFMAAKNPRAYLKRRFGH